RWVVFKADIIFNILTGKALSLRAYYSDVAKIASDPLDPPIRLNNGFYQKNNWSVCFVRHARRRVFYVLVAKADYSRGGGSD
ncbi:hypothetical protein, partial [Duganella sp.]|uniref:hypothetical protein n=1 Tax=Duganella sp. TaxID=1904440 RepID=UPI0031D92A72